MKRELGIGYCGLVCALCSENEMCVGCKKRGCLNSENCKSYQCCTQKGYANCGECEQFPCKDRMLSKIRIATFCQFVIDFGEDTLLDCLERNEKMGIQYHYEHKIIGDYDLATKEEIYKMIKNGNFVKEAE